MLLKALATVCLFSALTFTTQAQSETPPQVQRGAPAVIVRSPRLSQSRRYKTDLHIEVRNVSDRIIDSLDIQFDVVDRLRKVVRDRLFMTLDAPGVGRWHGIKPNKSSVITMPVDYRIPEGAGDGYGNYWCLDCAVINVVHFTDGSKWEREGWRDEPKP